MLLLLMFLTSPIQKVFTVRLACTQRCDDFTHVDDIIEAEKGKKQKPAARFVFCRVFLARPSITSKPDFSPWYIIWMIRMPRSNVDLSKLPSC